MDDKTGSSPNNGLTHQEEAYQYRVLVESMNDGFGIINDEGIFTYVNPRFAEMLEYTANQMIGKAVTDFLDEKNRKILREELSGWIKIIPQDDTALKLKETLENVLAEKSSFFKAFKSNLGWFKQNKEDKNERGKT